MSRLNRLLRRTFVRTTIRRRLAAAAAVSGPIRLRVEDRPIGAGRHHFELEKSRASILMRFDFQRIRHDRWMHDVFTVRPGAIIALFAATSAAVQGCRAEVSDGEESAAGVISYCSSEPASVLVTDCEFFATQGYSAMRRAADVASVPWRDRGDLVLWRGATTGIGVIALGPLSPSNSALIQRVRLCLAARDLPNCDVRIARVVQSSFPERDEATLHGAGLIGEQRDPADWLQVRYAIDVDGNSNAWSNLFRRLLAGCCVLKVASPVGYRQWYYGEIEPWRHYVPVAADLSDLAERIAWCRAHLPECEAIAAEGRALARSMTFEQEFERCVASIERAFGA